MKKVFFYLSLLTCFVTRGAEQQSDPGRSLQHLLTYIGCADDEADQLANIKTLISNNADYDFDALDYNPFCTIVGFSGQKCCDVAEVLANHPKFQSYARSGDWVFGAVFFAQDNAVDVINTIAGAVEGIELDSKKNAHCMTARDWARGKIKASVTPSRYEEILACLDAIDERQKRKESELGDGDSKQQ